jgi:hypothetical protein
MSLRELMVEELARGLRVVRDGHELVPARRIITPEGDYMILKRFDLNKPERVGNNEKPVGERRDRGFAAGSAAMASIRAVSVWEWNSIRNLLYEAGRSAPG